MTGKAVLEALVREKGYKKSDLPAENTMRRLLNEMGYRLRRVQKTTPKKDSRMRSDLRQHKSGACT